MTYLRPTMVALAATLAIPVAACSAESTDYAANDTAAETTQMANMTDAVPATATAQTTIVDAAVASPDHSTLVSAVQAAGLAETLSGPGPFTVFAPTNAAFAALPAGTLDTLLQPANREQLSSILTYHVVPQNVTAAALIEMIEAGGGSASLTTVQGGQLTARLQGSNVVLTDAAGGTATVTQPDLIQSNGVIHVTDAVSMPG